MSSGKVVGGVPFTKGPLCHLLKNRTYIGEINHHCASYPGEHQPILSEELFDAVQATLTENMQVAGAMRSANRALLAGKIFDDRGNRMTPSFSVKKGIRYRYYDCRLLIEGRSAEAGAFRRVSAPDIEKRVLEALAGLKGAEFRDELWSNPQAGHELVRQLVDRIVVENGNIKLKLTAEAASTFNRSELDIPWVKPPARPKREILLAHTDPSKDGRPIRAEVRASVVQAVALGRAWLQQLVSGEVVDAETIARREDRSKRSVHMMISLAFVAPDIIEALIAGRLPRGIGITRLTDLPLEWAKQRKTLGLSNRSPHLSEPISA
jgi:hypothetical protein